MTTLRIDEKRRVVLSALIGGFAVPGILALGILLKGRALSSLPYMNYWPYLGLVTLGGLAVTVIGFRDHCILALQEDRLVIHYPLHLFYKTYDYPVDAIASVSFTRTLRGMQEMNLLFHPGRGITDKHGMLQTSTSHANLFSKKSLALIADALRSAGVTVAEK